MKRLLFFFITFPALLGPVCFAQKGSDLKQLPKTIEVFRPEALDRPISIEIAQSITSGHGQKVSSESFVKQAWDVYSDREDNTTYATPKDKTPYSSLKMGEKVRIARFRGDFALVYSVDENDRTPYPRLPLQVDWKGWIPVSKLLLWEKPLVSEDGVKIRVMLDGAVLSATPSDIVGKLYHNPAPNAVPRQSLPSLTSNTFFYLLKQEGTMCLLASDKEPGQNLENLFGWVSNSSLCFWDHNLALEPTWEISSVKDFSSIGFFSSICSTMSEEAKVGEVRFESKEMPLYRTDFYRLPGGIWRFPFNVSLPGNYDSVFVPTNSPFLTTAAGSNARMLNEDISNVNVYFVMDGSRDLEDFFPAVMESMKGMQQAMPSLNLKVGSVIYHDIRNEDFMTEFCPASEISNRSLLDFIDQGGDYGFQDNSSEPAMFAAIQKVLDEGRLRPSETNVIIVIGSKGDASGISLDELADRLDGSNVSVYGVQVQNNVLSTSSQLFRFQVENLINSKLSSRIKKTGTERDVILRSVWKGDAIDVVNFALNTPDRTCAEEFRSVNNGLMEEDSFRDCLNAIYGKIAAEVDNQKLSGASVSDKSQTFNGLYVTKRDGSNRPFYKYVALYDEEEFEQMMTGFQELYNLALRAETPARQYYDLLLSFLEVVPDSSPIKREDRGYYETFRLYEGINMIPNEFKGMPIKNLRDLKGVTAEEGRKLMDDFILKYQKLLEIKNAAYPYISVVNGRRCYWIPVEYLP